MYYLVIATYLLSRYYNLIIYTFNRQLKMGKGLNRNIMTLSVFKTHGFSWKRVRLYSWFIYIVFENIFEI